MKNNSKLSHRERFLKISKDLESNAINLDEAFKLMRELIVDTVYPYIEKVVEREEIYVEKIRSLDDYEFSILRRNDD